MSIYWLNYILTACGIALTLSGLVLTTYSWYNLHRADRLIEEKVQSHLAEIEERLDKRFSRIAEAIEAFFEANSLFPERFETYLNLARVYAQIDKVELALKYLRDGLERKPQAGTEIEQDPAFAALRQKDPEQFQAIIARFVEQ